MIKYAIQQEGADKVAVAIIGDDMIEMTQLRKNIPLLVRKYYNS